MASEAGAKWIVALSLYFVMMFLIVSLVSNISGTTIPTTGGLITDPAGVRCGLPRTTYENGYDANDVRTIFSFNTDVDYPTIKLSSDNTPMPFLTTTKRTKVIECKYSEGLLGQTECEALSGCEWDSVFTFRFWLPAVYTCKGVLNYSWIDPGDVKTFWGAGTFKYIDYVNETEGICRYSDVENNQTLCEQMGCRWGYQSGSSIDVFGDVDPGLGFFKQIWKTIREMATFRFTFGFTDANAIFLLNTILFLIPALGLIFAVYLVLRA